MQRALSLWAFAALMLFAAGCSMCGHPYDYCGPVHNDGVCSNCDTRTRSGSILAPAGGQVVRSGQVTQGQILSEEAPSGEVIFEGPAIEGPVSEGPLSEGPLSGNVSRNGKWTARAPAAPRR